MHVIYPPKQRPRSIQDIQPTTQNGWDIKSSVIRTQSLHFLDTIYKKSRLKTRPTKIKLTYAGSPIKIPVNRNITNSRLYRQLSVSAKQNLVRIKETFDQTMDRLLKLVGLSGIGLRTTARNIHNRKWLPKKYTLKRGVHTNWGSSTFVAAKAVTPIILLALGVLVYGQRSLMNSDPIVVTEGSETTVNTPTAPEEGATKPGDSGDTNQPAVQHPQPPYRPTPTYTRSTGATSATPQSSPQPQTSAAPLPIGGGGNTDTDNTGIIKDIEDIIAPTPTPPVEPLVDTLLDP